MILRKYKNSDLYTGLVVASKIEHVYINIKDISYLYELNILDYYIKYRAVAVIIRSKVSIIQGSWFSMNSNIQDYFFCETEYSRNMNLADIREDKLNKLLK